MAEVCVKAHRVVIVKSEAETPEIGGNYEFSTLCH